MGVVLKIYFGDSPYTCREEAGENCAKTGWPSDEFTEALRKRAVHSGEEATFVLGLSDLLVAMAEIYEKDKESACEKDVEMVHNILRSMQYDFDKFVCITWG
jgi:hypothetical protein